MASRTQWNQDTSSPKALHRSQNVSLVIISFSVHSSVRRPETVPHFDKWGWTQKGQATGAEAPQQQLHSPLRQAFHSFPILSN